MKPGAIVARGERLYAVLASSGNRLAVASVAFDRRKSRAGDELVTIGPLGPATIVCGSATIDAGVWTDTGIALTATDLRLCVMAAERAKRSEAEQRYRPLEVRYSRHPHQ